MYRKILLDMCKLLILLSKTNFKNHQAQPVTEGSNLRCYIPTPNPTPIEHGSDPYKKATFSPTSSTYQKYLKLGQCLEIDDKRSLNKFGDVT